MTKLFWVVGWILTMLVGLASLAMSATDFDGLPTIETCTVNQDPLSNGGQWTTDVISTHASTVEANGTICRRDTASGIGSTWWNVETFANVAISMTMPDATATVSQYLLLYVRLNAPGVASSTDGYYCAFNPFLSQVGFNRIDNSADTFLANCESVSIGDGDQLACQAVGSELSIHVGRSGVWTEECTYTEATYAGPGAVGFSFTNNGYTVDNVQAGAVAGPGVSAGDGLMPVIW